MRVLTEYIDTFARFGNIPGPQQGDIDVHLINGSAYTLPSGSVIVMDLGVVMDFTDVDGSGLMFVAWSNVAWIKDSPPGQ